MKIVVKVVVNIPDTKEWTTTFGVEGAQAIREDVKSYIGDGVQQYGVFGDGEVTADITWS